MPPQFTPQPYIDFDEAKEAICGHFFPAPADDTELLAAIEKDKELLVKAGAQGTTEIFVREDTRPLKVKSMIPSGMYTTSENKVTREAVRHYQFNDDVKHSYIVLDHAEKAIENGLFKLGVAFSVQKRRPDLPGSVGLLGWLTTQQPPHGFSLSSIPKSLSPELIAALSAPLASQTLWKKRQAHFLRQMRSALWDGSLTPFWLAPGHGVLEFPEPSVWLDEAMSWEALRTGMGKPYLNAKATRMVFDPDNIEEAFSHQNAIVEEKKVSLGRVPDVTQAIRRELNRRHPDGYGGQQASLRREISAAIGRSPEIDPKTFKNALDAHNEAVGFSD